MVVALAAGEHVGGVLVQGNQGCHAVGNGLDGHPCQVFVGCSLRHALCQLGLYEHHAHGRKGHRGAPMGYFLQLGHGNAHAQGGALKELAHGGGAAVVGGDLLHAAVGYLHDLGFLAADVDHDAVGAEQEVGSLAVADGNVHVLLGVVDCHLADAGGGEGAVFPGVAVGFQLLQAALGRIAAVQAGGEDEVVDQLVAFEHGHLGGDGANAHADAVVGAVFVILLFAGKVDRVHERGNARI